MRVYAIQYNFYESQGGSFKYAAHPKFETRTEFYAKHTRDAFLDRYLHLKKNEHLYIGEIKCFFGDVDDITDKMDEVINAI